MVNFEKMVRGMLGQNTALETQAVRGINFEINSYLGRNGIVDSDGFYRSNVVNGEIFYDLSGFNQLAVRRIMSRVSQNFRYMNVSASYDYSRRIVFFTIKFR